MLMSNKASLGGAIHIVAVEDKQTIFMECVFESNEAADGGAVYLYTGPGVDIFTASVFRNNFAGALPRHISICKIELPQRIIAHSQNIGDRVRQYSLLRRLQHANFSATSSNTVKHKLVQAEHHNISTKRSAIAISNQFGRRHDHAAPCVAPYRPSAFQFKAIILVSLLFQQGSIYDRDMAPSSFFGLFALMLVTLRFMMTPYI